MITSYARSFIQTISVQEVLWTHIEDKSEFDIELISPMRATINEFCDGSYIRFVVQVIRSNDVPILDDSDIMVFHVPLKTWERAMYTIPLNKKRDWTNIGMDNIFISIKKINKSHLTFLKVETRNLNADQKEMADIHYMTKAEIKEKNAEDLKRQIYFEKSRRRRGFRANS